MMMNDEDFIRAWQSDMPASKMAEKFGVTQSTIYARAKTLKKLGIPLIKRHAGTARHRDIESLKKLAQSLNEKKQA